MRYHTSKDIYKAAAAEAGISEEHMEFLAKNLFTSIRHCLVDPLNHWKGIVIQNFLKFYIQPVSVDEQRKVYKKDILEQLHEILQKDEQKKKEKNRGNKDG